jgi:predicted nucleotidyltransferase
VVGWRPHAIPTIHAVRRSQGVATAETRLLPGGLSIRLVAPAYFIATKLEAFFGRGKGDYFGSHDLEDLIAVVDGRLTIVGEIETLCIVWWPSLQRDNYAISSPR